MFLVAIFAQIFFTTPPLTECYILETQVPILYHDPFKTAFNRPQNARESYFGFSVIMYPGKTGEAPWIQIGAPRGFIPNINVVEPGLIVRCGIYGRCQRINVDTDNTNRNSYQWTEAGRKLYRNKIDKAFIGNTMDIDLKHGRTVVCGHRWINALQNQHLYYAEGACYWNFINFTNYDNLLIDFKVIPLILETTVQTEGQNVFYAALGQAGFSMQLTDADEPELISGAPGLYNWKGGALKMTDVFDTSGVKRTFGRNNVPDATKNFNVDAFALDGYAITSGRFFGRRELLYVSGAPKQSYKGQILVFQFQPRTNQGYLVKAIKKGTQVGEYFGAALASGDVNGDGFDDLVVGSPFYAAESFNEGRIHVYLGNVTGELVEPRRGHIIKGKHQGGLFGLSMTYLGDLDKDGFGDVAVGAPYEDENVGVVYIFMGTSEGLNPEPAQTLLGKSVDLSIRGFGISIAKPADIDRNRFADIAIGAHLSGHVVLFRSKKVVILYQTIVPSVERLATGQEKFTVQICQSYRSDSPPESINVTRTIIIDEGRKRGTLLNETTSTVTIAKRQMRCETFHIQMKPKTEEINLYEPFSIEVRQQLTDQKPTRTVINVMESTLPSSIRDPFDSNSVVCNEIKSNLRQIKRIPFSLGCKNIDVCNAALELTTEFTNVKKYDRNGENRDDAKNRYNEFVVGSFNNLKLITTVKNSGENAYFTRVSLSLPEGVFFQKINSTCEKIDDSTRACFLENPLKPGAEKGLTFDLDMTNVNPDSGTLNFNVTLLTSSNNTVESQHYVPLRLIQEADLEITGKSDEDSYNLNITMDHVNFTQLFSVQKHGHSPLKGVLLEIFVPRRLNSEEGELEFLEIYQPEGYLNKQPLICRSDVNYLHDKVIGEIDDSLTPFLEAEAYSAVEGKDGDPLKGSRIGEENAKGGTMVEGTMEEGTVEEGTVEEGTVEEGTMERGNTQRGNTKKGNINKGNPNKGNTNKGNLEGNTEMKIVPKGENRRKRESKTSDAELIEGVPLLKETNLELSAEELEHLPLNRTFFLNCSTPDVECLKIRCKFGPLVGVGKQANANLLLRMVFSPTKLAGKLLKKDLIKLSSVAKVTVIDPQNFKQSGNKPDRVVVNSIFNGEGPPKPIAIWIIILAILVGLALLALAVFGLVKAGFFRRTRKDELEALKQAEADVEFDQRTVASMDDIDMEKEVYENNSAN